MPTPFTDALLRTVRFRLNCTAGARACSLWVLLAGGAFMVFLFASRFLGVATGAANWSTFAAVLGAAMVCGIFFRRRPTLVDAARCVDRQGSTKDLFLTVASLQTTASGYEPIVASQAEHHAPRISPSAAVPVEPDRTAAFAAALVAGAVLGMLYLPQWDPFGKISAVNAARQLDKQLLEERDATRTRAAALKQQVTDVGDSTKAEQSVEMLQTSLQQMKPQERQPNLEKLNIHQGDLGKQWRTLGAEKLRSLIAKESSLQDFGGGRLQKIEDWADQVRQGDAQLVQQEISDLADLAQDIAEEKDPARRAELVREMKERLKDLERFASERAGSPEMASAIRRAMRQMEAAQQQGEQGLSEQAIKDLQESLELSKLEMQQLAEAAQELQKLEKALKTTQMAKQLNEQGRLDGEACENCQTLDDYVKLYSEMMNGGEASSGEGMGNRGFGEGGKAPEDDSAKTAFQDENSKSAISAGKSLLSMKSRGMGERGVVGKEYREQVGKVKQSVSEAILQEQVPPGYHESIRGYFDAMPAPEDAAAP